MDNAQDIISNLEKILILFQSRGTGLCYKIVKKDLVYSNIVALYNLIKSDKYVDSQCMKDANFKNFNIYDNIRTVWDPITYIDFNIIYNYVRLVRDARILFKTTVEEYLCEFVPEGFGQILTNICI